MSHADGSAPHGQPVGWLELFFDLVFVVVVQQLTQLLHGSPGVPEVLLTAALTLLVWACWLNVTLLTNIAGGVPDRYRPLVFLSMGGVGVIAVSIPGVTTSSSWLFALGYAVARIAVWPLWVINRGPVRRSWLAPTLFGPGLGVAWLVSIVVPAPARWWFWAALLALELATVVSGVPHARRDAGHMIERVGLFVMIVLGESVAVLILSVGAGASLAEWSVAGIAFATICALWWVYYDLGSRASSSVRRDRSGVVFRDVLVAGHYLFVLSLVLVAAGLGGAIQHASDARLPGPTVALVAGGTGLFYVAQALTVLRYGARPRLVVTWSGLGIVVSAAVTWLGAAWPPWLVVLVIFAGALMLAVVGAVLRRRYETTPASVA